MTDNPTKGPRAADARAASGDDVSESMPRASGSRQAPTLGAGAIGCVCRSDQTLDAAAAGLAGLEIAKTQLHLGASDESRALAAAQRLGIAADLQPDDPLGGLVAPGDGSAPRTAIDRAGTFGALLGAAAGAAIAFTPAGRLVSAPQTLLVAANAALYFVLGGIVGSVLGAALAPQPSTHSGFRLIDGMQEGAYALIAVAPRERHDELQRALEGAGATGITRL